MVHTKNKLLLLGIVLMMIISYYVALEKTILLREEYISLTKQNKASNRIPATLVSLKKENDYYTTILKNANVNNTSVQNNLLRTINGQAKEHNVRVMDINEPHVHQKNTTTKITYNFNLEGTFTDIVKIIYKLEEKNSFGTIIHLDFNKRRNFKRNKEYLNAIVYIQQVK